ncbi:MAG: thioesterase family protein [Gammaproteobacteria bacterium]|nr:thioesterase family protein [Gammaproteobacteria bacterium]MCY4219377.1 thioesterase family protein [Gammaproteobacteria bacterium]MCY4275987.1 thioesterase family protein [Gammaproteobacteria bacterium]
MFFEFETLVGPEWIDYNGHMRDSNYGLVFSLAVDAMQNEVGLDAAYRERTGCTIYLLEDHKFYLREVKQGDRLQVITYVMGVDNKRFHLYMIMKRDQIEVCVGEFMEIHVQQYPSPYSTSMPLEIQQRLMAYQKSLKEGTEPFLRSRPIGLLSPKLTGSYY